MRNFFFIITLTFLIQTQCVYGLNKPKMASIEKKSLEVVSSEKYELAKTFFESFDFYASILRSVLDNKCAGTVFTDNKNNPSFFLVCTPSTPSTPNAYAYLAGELDNCSLKQVMAYLKSLPKISLVVPLKWKFRTFFEKNGFKPVERMQLRRSSDLFDLGIWKQFLPSHYSICKIDAENFEKCNWHHFIVHIYGDKDHFFENGKGFCLVDQEKIVSESYALISNRTAEIGVVTNKQYRGQNFGTTISAIALDYCYKNNIEPYWNCDVTNPASSAIAKKLGFEEQSKYLFLKWVSPSK